MTGKKENIQSGEDEKQELISVGSVEEIGYVIYQILTKGKTKEK